MDQVKRLLASAPECQAVIGMPPVLLKHIF